MDYRHHTWPDRSTIPCRMSVHTVHTLCVCVCVCVSVVTGVCLLSVQSDMTTVLVGFNPVSLSRDAPIEKWDKTCQEVSLSLSLPHQLFTATITPSHVPLVQVFLELEALSSKSDRAVILNPVVGPEPITG